MKKRIGLLYGGKSAEHEVSLSTALAVTKALDFDAYEVYPIYITHDGEWRKGERLEKMAETIEQLQLAGDLSKPNDISSFLPLQSDKALDVIIPLLHGPNGEDGTVQGLLEVMNLPYVGNGVLASSAGMDKVVMKQLFEQAGLNQTPYVYFIRRDWETNQDFWVEKVEAELAWPVFVKPANLGSSVGISKADNREELVAAVKEALKYDRKIVVEQGVVAREIEVGVLGNDEPECSVAGEIKPLKAFYDYQAKYKDGNTAMVIPAELDETVYAKLEEDAKKAFKILDCSGLVRADFFVTEANEILINEVNTLPGFTPYSMFPLLWENTGLPYPQLIERLVSLAIERHEEKQLLQVKID
ncbi:D-alanine--D-alanine ligase [Microbacterium sp. APC 3898]|uniref:D-alanine--D-alanine ligase n=2 Tax=Planococcus TaxID=1372 RepID=A0ABT7ZMA7_9BACL|nr:MULTISPECIES: D-alanine--D-alanine ligase [Terrabacteria group]MBD8015392.1 D-alanine--D-alanine ligase [Planococcus wigleyi]MDN3428279.1 D-alanine--D-alanine ligase [Planococcus sp. APC 4016]MDN3439402.1 D-alanine--D-alanine ligase [Planococcus sp. APC 3900]MDN3498183.1 D-alanine--D-alanine ligase [Microbacterium sp. APC 3898]